MTLKVRSIRVQHSMLDVFERRQTCVWNVRVWEHTIYGAGSGEATCMQRRSSCNADLHHVGKMHVTLSDSPPKTGMFGPQSRAVRPRHTSLASHRDHVPAQRALERAAQRETGDARRGGGHGRGLARPPAPRDLSQSFSRPLSQASGVSTNKWKSAASKVSGFAMIRSLLEPEALVELTEESSNV